jgi:peptidoglycan hydrolase-like protein with peptidoglycan-binding domain
MRTTFFRSAGIIAASVALYLVIAMLAGGTASAAEAQDEALAQGSHGEAVRELQIQIAGWFDRDDQRYLRTNGRFGPRTVQALVNFQEHYGLKADGVAGAKVFKILDTLEDEDGSTLHFDWYEFQQNINSRCSMEANKAAGTFWNGLAPRETVKENVRRLMWRLEVLRAKSGDEPVAITSGFRSVAYNKCIGGASLSQHLFGTAADLRVGGTSNRAVRNKARATQFHGIGCYSNFTHNHLDMRLDNDELPAAQYWWWPEQDSKGHDLADDGRPCAGEASASARVASGTGRSLSDVLRVGSKVPTRREIDALKGSVETLNWGD